MTTRLVVTIHGIKTRGVWQKELTPHLAKLGLVPYHIDYGIFGLPRFLLCCTREAQINKVRAELRRLVQAADARRVSLVAHSFGTYIAMEAVRRENGNLRFDRVVLSGSILPVDFDWNKYFAEDWVVAVRNQRATQDWAVSLAKLMSCRPFRWITRLRAGDSGRNSFEAIHAQLVDDFIEGGHSETHNPLQFDKWARFLAYPRMSTARQKLVRAELQAFRQNGARHLGYDVNRVRVNLFGMIDGALRMLPSVADNMTFAPEYELEILPGQGGTGDAYQNGVICVLSKTGDSWSGNNLPTAELAKIHPELGWIVSLPVKGEEDGPALGVVNIDGLGELPEVLRDKSSEAFAAVLLALQGEVAGRIEPLLTKAYWGQE
jgi:pimeloyl-ACP methyl ester carboxylesterase